LGQHDNAIRRLQRAIDLDPNSTFARGTEMLGGAYTFLDLTALGRQEDWEEPRGRAGDAHRAIPDFSE